MGTSRKLLKSDSSSGFREASSLFLLLGKSASRRELQAAGG
jgi:hypothetical protein